MVKCLVPGCPSKFNFVTNKRKMSFFQIPNGEKDPRKMPLAEKWLKFCGLNASIFPFGRQLQSICEKHFLPQDMEFMNMKEPGGFNGHRPKRVKPGAVPKIFDIRDAIDILPTREIYQVAAPVDANNNFLADATETCHERYLNDFVPDPLDKPPTVERKEAADLARWPPDIQISTTDIKHILTCGICNSYFYKATTITVCLHTFCKGCLVNHFYRSLHCPTCDVLVHPSDPFACIKSDTILQDIVYKIFPGRLLADKKAEIDFYTSRGLNPPDSKTPDSVPATVPVTEKVEMISLRLDYAGTTKSLPPHPPLEKNFLRIPNNVTIGQIIKFLHMKMQLPAGSQAALFINCFMLNEALTVSRLEEIFGEQMHEQYSKLIILEYGIIPKSNYFDNGLLVGTKYL